MKLNLIYCLMIALTIGGCSQPKSSKIEGTWKLVEYRTIRGLSVVIDFPGKSDIDVTKIWSGNHFMCVGRSRIKADTTVTDWFGLGTYKLDGNKYEEKVSILFYKPWEGTTIKMKMEMKNDTLIVNYPVDDKGQMDKDWAWIEKYVRQ
ncbi:MAG: hypothetical protein Q8N05_05285 [Bacteroidota bacterium]|nr:hypothetical protein [Bacteroidota bacterium]